MLVLLGCCGSFALFCSLGRNARRYARISMTPSTESIFCASAISSGLVTSQQLDYASRVARHRQTQQGLSPVAPLPDRLLADLLVEQETLTPYQADQLLEGRTKLTLGPYLITDWIGQGGMGQVFKGVHQLMGRECAVKVLPRARATEASLENFRREIRMQAGLDCPYLVRAFDAGQDGNVHFLVTEYVPGMDLRRLVRSRGALPVQQAAKIIMQAALGLDYAHGKGLVHRDVKPGNILVTPAGEAKVSDVGLAGFAKDFINDPRAGKIVGTTDYISPEQIRSPLEIHTASDIYSLGCTLYYAVCGKVPFPGGDTTSKLRRHLEETPWHPRRMAIDITEDFVDIIADMMEKDIHKRIANAAEVASRLEPWAIADMSVGSMGLTRSPWMAPPPPSHEYEKRQLDEATLDTSAALDLNQTTWNQPGQDEASAWPPYEMDGHSSLDASSPPAIEQSSAASLNETGSASTVLPAIPPAIAQPTAVAANKLSTAMVIALTIAIAVPPALLIGAILGYLAAQ